MILCSNNNNIRQVINLNSTAELASTSRCNSLRSVVRKPSPISQQPMWKSRLTRRGECNALERYRYCTSLNKGDCGVVYVIVHSLISQDLCQMLSRAACHMFKRAAVFDQSPEPTQQQQPREPPQQHQPPEPFQQRHWGPRPRPRLSAYRPLEHLLSQALELHRQCPSPNIGRFRQPQGPCRVE